MIVGDRRRLLAGQTWLGGLGEECGLRIFFFYLFVCLVVSKEFNCCTFSAFTFIQPLFLLCANRFSDRRLAPWLPDGFFSRCCLWRKLSGETAIVSQFSPQATGKKPLWHPGQAGGQGKTTRNVFGVVGDVFVGHIPAGCSRRRKTLFPFPFKHLPRSTQTDQFDSLILNAGKSSLHRLELKEKRGTPEVVSSVCKRN